MEPEKVLKSNVWKSLLKGTIAIAALTPFLQLSWAHFENYLIFVGFYYLLVGLYMVNKGTTEYRVGDTGLTIRRLWRKEIAVGYDNVRDLGYSQGMLAKRFNCGTVYVELKRGKGSHKTTAGVQVVQLKDVPNPIELMSEISDMLGPFAGTPTDGGAQTSSM